jgi:recombination DNA repair RAD52 pathway protein
VPLTPAQYDQLRKPLNVLRVAKRSQGGKQLSYLESFDVRAHLIRVFGYCNFDAQVVAREYMSQNDKEMVEVIYSARVRLDIRDSHGDHLCTYMEGAVGSASGPATMLGEHHDNALKTAASDALKRCAINLGTQFGLSLYQDGSTRDVVKGTIVVPEGYEPPPTDEKAVEAIQHTLGAVDINAEPPVAPPLPKAEEAKA